jgi:peroxiredoxin
VGLQARDHGGVVVPGGVIRRVFLSAVGSLAVLWLGLLGMNRYADQPHEQVPSTTREKASSPATEKHYVTPRQLAASGAMTNRLVAPFTAVTQAGQPIAWAELSGGQPVVLVFIKKGCPCNVELEPFFQRLETAYRDCVRFAGVIDGSVDVACQYAAANHVPHPILADPEHQLIVRFQAESGVYVALVTPSGVLDTLWPGCSAEMMQELSRRSAELAGVEERPVDYTGMPNALTTGCPFSP